MTPEERRVVRATLEWIKLAKEAGYNADGGHLGWPSPADADHSGLLDRLLHGGIVFPTAAEFNAALEAEQGWQRHD